MSHLQLSWQSHSAEMHGLHVQKKMARLCQHGWQKDLECSEGSCLHINELLREYACLTNSLSLIGSALTSTSAHLSESAAPAMHLKHCTAMGTCAQVALRRP